MPGSCSASRIGWSSLSPRRVNSAVSTLAVAWCELCDEVDEPGKVLLALARAEVDAEPACDRASGFASSRPECSMAIVRGGDGELAVSAVLGPAAGVVDVVVEPEVRHFGGDPGGEGAGVEERDRADAALALEQGATRSSPGRGRPE